MQYFDNNDKLRSELRVLKYSYGEYNLEFYSDLGMFSKDKIDLGSKSLLETYLKDGKKNSRVLDVGCGYGFLGISIAKIMDSSVDMVDVNNRAIHLCEMNIKNNKVNAKVFVSDTYDKINNKYDVIISNPPIRAGKKIYLKIINDAFNYLNVGGELWFVMRTNHGVKTVVKSLKLNHKVDILEKINGFYVIRAKID